MNKIKSYYWYVGIPIAALALGTVLFFDLIVSTVTGNPHPEVNYVIFILIVAGSAMMWQQVARMNRDARSIEAFYEVAVSKPNVEDLRKMLSGKRNDTHPVLEIITDLIGKPVSSVQHAALEAELDRYKAVQMRYMILPNFMSGMMVGMGLLGTFIGLLGALAEISKLIGAFSIATSGDPAAAIRILVERLTSPMQAMGVAFSASLFGVLGSLVMGVLLVGVRNCAGELNSLLDTRVTYLTDFGRSVDEGAEASGLSDAVSALAEQSPILSGLIKAMDQSERRVRDLINSVVQISSRLELNQASNSALVQAIQSRLSNEEAIYQSMQSTQDSLALIATRWSNANQVENQMASLIQQHAQQNERFLNSFEQSNSQHQVLSERLVGALAEGQTNQAQAAEQLTLLNKVLGESALQTSEKLGDIAGVQRRGTDQVAEILQNGLNDMAAVLNKALAESALQTSEKLGDIAGVQRRGTDQVAEILQNGFKDMAAVQSRSADSYAEATQAGLRDLAGAQRRAADEMNKELAKQMIAISEVMVSGQAEQAQLTQQMNRVSDVLSSMITANQTGLQRVVDTYQRNFETTVREQSEASNALTNVLKSAQSAQLASLKGIDTTMNQLSLALRTDAQARSELANRIELQVQDYGTRQEMFAQSVLESVTVLAQRDTPKARKAPAASAGTNTDKL